MTRRRNRLPEHAAKARQVRKIKVRNLGMPVKVRFNQQGDTMNIEQEIQDKGLTAPRITTADVEAAIASEWYINAGGGVIPDDFQPPVPANHPLWPLTFCVLVLKNGYTVTGESACVSPENFDAEIGRKIARQNAVEKVWPLLGYALKEKLSNDHPG
jgi:hypothetical protein